MFRGLGVGMSHDVVLADVSLQLFTAICCGSNYKVRIRGLGTQATIITMEAAKLPLHVMSGLFGFTGGLLVVPFFELWRRKAAKATENMEEEAKELARVSLMMYEPKAERRGVGQWVVVFNKDKYAIFSKGSTVLVAFEGTNIGSESRRSDLLNDYRILMNQDQHFGLPESDFIMNKVLECAERVAASAIVVTGHSLGGYVPKRGTRNMFLVL